MAGSQTLGRFEAGRDAPGRRTRRKKLLVDPPISDLGIMTRSDGWRRPGDGRLLDLGQGRLGWRCCLHRVRLLTLTFLYYRRLTPLSHVHENPSASTPVQSSLLRQVALFIYYWHPPCQMLRLFWETSAFYCDAAWVRHGCLEPQPTNATTGPVPRLYPGFAGCSLKNILPGNLVKIV
jgi:hypothetical protein